MHDHLTIRKLSTLHEMLPHFALIKQLTSSLTEEEYTHMLGEMIPHNYYQLAVYLEHTCIAVSGYWLGTKLYSGRYLEIDNFVVDEPYRSGGIGKLLVDQLCEEARANGCRVVMLDAYVENFKAHHFYYREGFIARGFHYLKYL